MDGKTLFFVVLSGLFFLSAGVSRTYVLVEKAMTWADARDYCRQKYTDLASVDNKEDMDQLLTSTEKWYPGHLWTGLYDDINSWRWSLEKEGYYGEGEAAFRMWANGEPNNWGGNQYCGSMDADGSWSDSLCKAKYMFVCYNVKSSSFIFVNESKTWTEAQSYCREHYTDLASVRNPAENDQIKTMVQNRNTWIGLYRDSWKWSDGSHTSFRSWHDNEPNGDPCAALHRGQWLDWKCQHTLYFACHIVPVERQLVRVKLTKEDSSVDLEAAAETILLQFSQTLKDQGLSKDMKLTWRKHPDGKIFHLGEKKERKESSDRAVCPSQ